MSALRAGLVLSRAPIISPKLGPFEDAFLKYQRALEQRLMWTFPANFYFKRGTLSARRFQELQRGPVPKHKDVIYPQGNPDIRFNRDRRFAQEVQLPKGLVGAGSGDKSDAGVNPLPRTTEADAKNDQKSLSRRLDESLYLLVKSKDSKNQWRFPSFAVTDSHSSLDQCAEQGLRTIGGENINTKTVSPTPAMCLEGKAAIAEGETEFLIKSHVLHGQFKPSADVDFAWLSKDEIAERVAPEYYERVKLLF